MHESSKTSPEGTTPSGTGSRGFFAGSSGRKRLIAILILLWTGWVAGVAYKTGRGDKGDAAEQNVHLSQEVRILQEQLQIADDNWTECILDTHIYDPGQTTLRNIAQ
jgi:hypothetical protein